MYEITVRGNFSSAHQLRNYEGKCENIHGHNWIVKVSIKGPSLNEQGMLIDFKILKQILAAVLDDLDHKFLNENPPFDQINPTAELIAKHIYDEISHKLEDHLWVSRVMVWENEGNLATYYGKE